MKVIVGCDHAGFEYKKSLNEYLSLNGINFNDLGTNNCDSVDYPDYAHLVSEEVVVGADFGVLICGSGNGVSMAANKHKKIRAALCWTPEISKLARAHNDANILSLPARFIKFEDAKNIIKKFLETPFEGGRHKQRVEKI